MLLIRTYEFFKKLFTLRINDMGLDTTHDCWHGAYSAFARWRCEAASAAGYMIGNLEYKGIITPTVLVDWGHLQDVLHGDWEQDPEDPLMVLIAHADDDGVIRHRHCKPLADRLTGLLDKIPEGDAGGHIGNWREKTQVFINGLLDAHSNDEDVEFH